MGFIEDLRQKIAREQIAHSEAIRKRELEETRQNQVRKKQAEKEAEEAKKRYNEALKYMNMSDFPRLTDELVSVMPGVKKTQGEWFSSSGRTHDDDTYLHSDLVRGAKIGLTWDRSESWSATEYKVIFIKFSPDGTVVVEGDRRRGSTILSHKDWYQKPDNVERSLEKAFHHPWIQTFTHSHDNRGSGGGPCLPGNSRISTPDGFVLIKDLRVGDYVWTVDGFGLRVKTVVVKKTKRPVAKNYKMVHIVLKDGRELVVSPGHPTIDYRELGSLVKGDDLDMSTVASIKVILYKGKYTYDILPYGDTGGYWANNILIGSTLSSQFEKTVLDGLYKPLHLSF